MILWPELPNVPEWDVGPEDEMQKDLFRELPLSGVYGNIVTTIDVVSKYVFAYPVSTPTAANTAKVIINIMTRHACLLTLIIQDKSFHFASH